MSEPVAEIRPGRAEVAEMVISCVQDVIAMRNGEAAVASPVGEDTRLIGREAALDSLGLVSVIVEVEQRLEERYRLTLILADERAMSQRHSPFRSVRSLTDYICQRLEEAGHGVG
jgi:acyl carrier protein